MRDRLRKRSHHWLGIDRVTPANRARNTAIVVKSGKNNFLYVSRHGIDLDNPGPNSSTSILNSRSPGEAVPSTPLSDSGDSTGNRSTDNATPPMHFLTPHVEISIPYPEQSVNQHNPCPVLLNGDSPSSPQSADSNSNVPSSSHHQRSTNSNAIHRSVKFTIFRYI